MAKKEKIIKVKTVEEFEIVATIFLKAQLYPSHRLWPNEGFTKTQMF